MKYDLPNRHDSSRRPTGDRRPPRERGLVIQAIRGEYFDMSVTGTVKNGVIVLPPGTVLPEGAEVKVETIELPAQADPLAAAVEKLARPRTHLPKDYALNHGHYIRGEPKK